MKTLYRFLLPAVALVLSVPAGAFDCEGITPVVGESVTLELVGDFTSLTGVAAPPGDTERLFVVEQRGTICIVNLADDSPGPVFLNIRSKVSSGGESGLLGLAFHPDYAANGFFFVCYTRSREGACDSPPPGCPADFRFGRTERLVARYQVSGDSPDRADPESEKVLLAFCQPAGNNIAGRLEFGPNDGYLYISSGDGSGRGCSHAQRMDTFLGKILRIDVDRGDPYGIPATNPYATTEGALPEIWALGLRNPWGFSFDPDNGDLYIGDVGSNRWEEIDYQPGDSPGGENYEYPVREGNHDFRDVPYGPGDRVRPTFEYPYGRTSVVIGGVVYRGCRMPDLHGRYFLADRQQNWVRSLVVNESGHAVDVRDHTGAIKSGISGNMNQIRSFGVDGRGEMYIVERAGRRVGCAYDAGNHDDSGKTNA